MDLSLRTIRKNIAALSVFAIIASMLVVTGVANAAAVDYLDIEGGEWYEADVNWGLDNGVLDDTQVEFRAPDNASRAEFFTMVARGAAIPEVACDELLAPDMTADHWGCPYMTALFQEGVISGDGVGSETEGAFRPDHNIVRAEAAKVVVEAYGLTGTRLGSDVFTDVMVGDWFDGYMGIANENCVFRGVDNGNTVEPAREINRAESVVVVQRGANPTTDCAPVVSAGDLMVELAGTNPSAELIPLNVANHLMAAYSITASAEEDVTLNTVVLSLNALGSTDDFDVVRLYVDGVQVGGDKSVNSSERTATFSLSTVVVPAGGTIVLEVRANFDAVDAGSVDQLCIDVNTDVTATGASSLAAVGVSGDFALCGGLMTTTAATVGVLEYEVTQTNISDITIGNTTELAEVRLEMAGEDGALGKITFRQTGSADPEDFATMLLKLGSTVVSDSPSWDGDYLTFDLTGDPLDLPEGTPKTVTLIGDVVGGLGSDVLFDVQKDWHVEGLSQSGYGVNVVEGVIVTLDYRDIIGGNIAFAAVGPSSGDVASGADDFTFLYFNIATLGEPITINELTIAVTAVGPTHLDDIDDIRIWKKNLDDSWTLVAGPEDFEGNLTGTEEATLTESIYVPGATTTNFKITADIANLAADGDQYVIDVVGLNDAARTEIEYPDTTLVDVTTEVGGTSLLGKAQTVAKPEVVVTTSATPGDKSYVPSTTDISLAAWDFTASTADDLTLNSVTVDCTMIDVAGLPAFETCKNAFSTLYLVDEDTGFGVSTVQNMGESTDPDGTLTFSGLDFPITAGESARLILKGTMNGSPEATDQYQLEVADVNAKDSNSSTADEDLTGVTVRTITVAGVGTIAMTAADNSDTTPHALLADSSDQAVQRVKFEASLEEAWIIDDLSLTLNDLTPVTGMTEEADSAKMVFMDKNDVIVYETAYKPFAGGIATFSSLGVTVPGDPNDPIYATVYLELAGTADGGLSNTNIEVVVNGDNLFGAISSTTGAVAPLLSQTHVYYNAVPVLALDAANPPASDTAGISSQFEIMYIDLSNDADSAGPLTLTGITVDELGSCAMGNVMLRDAADNDLLTVAVPFGAIVAGDFSNLTGISLNPGTSETVKVVGDASGCLALETLSAEVSALTWDDGAGDIAAPATGIKKLPLASNGFKF